MLVEEVMSETVVTCDLEGTVRTAAERMLRNRIGSVIVTRDGDPYGIVTETDVLVAGTETGRPLDEVQLSAAVSRPLVTVGPGRSVRHAVDLMRDHDVKKLPVVEGIDLVGILTRTDIVYHYGDFVSEARSLESQRDEWTRSDDRGDSTD